MKFIDEVLDKSSTGFFVFIGLAFAYFIGKAILQNSKLTFAMILIAVGAITGFYILGWTYEKIKLSYWKRKALNKIAGGKNA